MTATPRQIAAIHAIAKRAGLDEDARRVIIERETGKRSSRALSGAEAGRVIDALQSLAGGRSAAATASGRYAAILRALWLSAWNLGVARSADDRALIAFVQRQTGVTHTRFLTGEDGALANRAIEGLKGWMARDAGVRWPARDAGPTAGRVAVIEAQWRRLAALGAVRVFDRERPEDDLGPYVCKVAGRPPRFEGQPLDHWRAFPANDLDQTIRALGRKLRGALARQRETAR